MSNKTNLLLISYVFPPYYGVGGRRWAKHSIALTRLGYTVHVICAKNPFEKPSLWYDEVKSNPNIIIHQLAGWYPKVLLTYVHNFLEKALYKFWVTLLPLLVKGTYFDRTIFWRRPMLTEANKLIRRYQIKQVICTGGPFCVMYYATHLKARHPGLTLVNDLRDPWTWGTNWGLSTMPHHRKAHEAMMERNMIAHSDFVTVPTLEMKRYLDENYKDYRHKFKLIPHFFDKSEITVQPKTKSSIIRFVAYGSIYHDIEFLIKELAQTLAAYRNELSLDMYTDKLQYKNLFFEFGAENVTFHEQVPARQLFSTFRDYDFVFLMLPSTGVDHISTKFYEIIYSQTPFFIFSKYGLAPKFVIDNNLGVHAEIGHLKERMNYLLQSRHKLNFNKTYDLSQYSLDAIARQITALFNVNQPAGTAAQVTVR